MEARVLHHCQDKLWLWLWLWLSVQKCRKLCGLCERAQRVGLRIRRNRVR